MLSFSPRAFIALFILLCVSSAYGHKQVVVVTLGGDDTPLEPTAPTAPVAKVNPSQTDYTLIAKTVIDKITKLEWQSGDDEVTSPSRNWNEALDYCAGLILDSKSDWRLPDIVELQSIVDYGMTSGPLIDDDAFTGTNSSVYWSASGRASSSSNAWVANFGFGSVGTYLKTNSAFVRCVR